MYVVEYVRVCIARARWHGQHARDVISARDRDRNITLTQDSGLTARSYNVAGSVVVMNIFHLCSKDLQRTLEQSTNPFLPKNVRNPNITGLM